MADLPFFAFGQRERLVSGPYRALPVVMCEPSLQAALMNTGAIAYRQGRTMDEVAAIGGGLRLNVVLDMTQPWR